MGDRELKIKPSIMRTWCIEILQMGIKDPIYKYVEAYCCEKVGAKSVKADGRIVHFDDYIGEPF